MPASVSRLWFAVGVSAFGTALSETAIPLVALLTLRLSTVEFGAVVAVEQAAWLVLGLPAGVLVDRWDRRRVAVVADLGRALLVAGVPLAAVTGVLDYPVLLALTLAVGVGNVFGGVAQGALVPGVVPESGVLAANARINLAGTVASLSGSAVVGPLVALTGPFVALLGDAVSYVLSAAALAGVRVRRQAPAAGESFRAQLAGGLAVVFSDRLFLGLTLGSAVFNAAVAAQYVLGLGLLHELGTPAVLYGVLLGAAGAGAVLGSALTARLGRRIGEARLWRCAIVAGPVVGLLVPLTSAGAGLLGYAAGTFGLSAAVAMSSVLSFSLRQRRCPPGLLGRLFATTRVLTWGVIPLAALGGGLLGEALGTRPALWLLAAVFFAEPALVRALGAWHWPPETAHPATT